MRSLGLVKNSNSSGGGTTGYPEAEHYEELKTVLRIAPHQMSKKNASLMSTCGNSHLHVIKMKNLLPTLPFRPADPHIEPDHPAPDIDPMVQILRL